MTETAARLTAAELAEFLADYEVGEVLDALGGDWPALEAIGIDAVAEWATREEYG